MRKLSIVVIALILLLVFCELWNVQDWEFYVSCLLNGVWTGTEWRNEN